MAKGVRPEDIAMAQQFMSSPGTGAPIAGGGPNLAPSMAAFHQSPKGQQVMSKVLAMHKGKGQKSNTRQKSQQVLPI